MTVPFGTELGSRSPSFFLLFLQKGQKASLPRILWLGELRDSISEPGSSVSCLHPHAFWHDTCHRQTSLSQQRRMSFSSEDRGMEVHPRRLQGLTWNCELVSFLVILFLFGSRHQGLPQPPTPPPPPPFTGVQTDAEPLRKPGMLCMGSGLIMQHRFAV